MWSDFLSRVYGFDGMFPRTLRDLTLRPGEAAREYIKGNRVRYYGPVGYFFIMITIYLLLASLLGVDLTEMTLKSSGTVSADQGVAQAEFSKSINAWIVDNMRLVSFVTALWSVVFYWLFFRKSGYNLVETAVVIFYANGHVYWLSIIILLLYWAAGISVYFVFHILLHSIYTIFSLVNFYQHISKFKIILRIILLYITYLVSFFLIAMLIGLAIGFFFPERFQQFSPRNNRPKTHIEIHENRERQT